MQLDSTQIVIRERNFPDILDLSLRVIVAHAGPLAVAALIGIMPWMALNYWLLAELVPAASDAPEQATHYLWLLFVLMIWEQPLATTPLTLYLGQALFVARPNLREMARMFSARLPQLLIVQVVGRGLFAGWGVWLSLSNGDPGLQALVGFGLVAQWFFIHLLWPYSNEVLLLERNPLWGRRARAATARHPATPARTGTLGRTVSLHGHAAGEVTSRWIVAFVVGWVLVGAYALSAASLVEFVLFEFADERWGYALYLPLAGWVVMAFLAVVRYLGYLDLRIRTEGWEVRLLMRAEGARVARQLA